MNAERFYQEYVSLVRPEILLEDGRSYLEVYKTYKGLTDLINKEVIEKIIKKLYGDSVTVQHEYFRIDTVGWESHSELIASEAKKVGISPHLWNLKVAVEHENSIKDWTDEIIKLIHVKCPLKVVIGYNHCDRRDLDVNIHKEGEASDIEKLKYVAEWMKKVEAFDPSDKEEYLIILGNAAGIDKKDYNEFDYRGYIYDNQKGEFSRIE